jgi:hypothetical protein
MKTAMFVLLSFSAALCAQDPQPKKAKEPDPQSAGVVKKLGSVTWDLQTHKLVWVVQTGSIVNGQFSAANEQKYEISPQEATMATTGETREVDGDEAASLKQLLDVLSLYCAESSVWWDSGLGTPVDSQQGPTKKVAPPSEGKPVRVGEPKERPAPRPIPANELVAKVRL